MKKIICKGKQFLLALNISYRTFSFLNGVQIVKFIFKRFVLRQHVPMLGIFSVTYRCQCSCVHCGVSEYINKKMTKECTEETKRVIDVFVRYGMLKVNFFGGEPLLRNDIVLLVAYAVRKGLRTSLSTNGILLTEPRILELKKAGIGNITVSIDSAEHKTHDRLRGYEGCFNAAVNALRLCVKHKIPAAISCYASKQSIADNNLSKIISLGEKIGVDAVKIRMPILAGKLKNSQEQRLNEHEIEYLKGLLKDHSRVYIEEAFYYVAFKEKCCSALKKQLIYVSPNGEVQPCPAIAVSLGNILSEGKLGRIFNKPIVKQFYSKYSGIDSCLVNTEQFRRSYYPINDEAVLPLAIEELLP
ncbi:MAG: radical SAM protein [Candidatus Omnitrophica bacterium]|nr:radical SAM protein [Candidatus Omnitrophota bacterium]